MWLNFSEQENFIGFLSRYIVETVQRLSVRAVLRRCIPYNTMLCIAGRQTLNRFAMSAVLRQSRMLAMLTQTEPCGLLRDGGQEPCGR